MDQASVTSWKELTLLQFGAMLKYCTANPNRRIYNEWKILLDAVRQADKACGKKNEKGMNVQVPGTETLLIYFLTFTAAAHKRFLDSSLRLDGLLQEYSLDLLAGNRGGAVSKLAGLVPDRRVSAGTLDPSQAGNGPEGVQWEKVRNGERAEQCWKQVLHHLEEEGAPAACARAGDAFAWLEEQNRHAYKAVLNAGGQRLFDLRTECEMGESYPRLLQLLDNWNPCCMRVWAAFQKKARLRLQELSAVLELNRNGDGYV